MGAPLVARREPVGNYRRPLELPYVFEQKTQYILIHAPYTRLVVFWHISNIPHNIFSQICYNTPMFCIRTHFLNIALHL